ncbi:MAG: adenylate kinase [Dehalococcoidia bacterium]|jgi:adenylate kinase|nr:adenylate kinase [Dehalococcoidia bacterium]
MNIILLGPPGSGKGTQSTYLSSAYKLNHISTGDILRSEISDKTKLGLQAESYMNSGDLVPDNLIIEMVSKKLSLLNSVLLDGFPRTLNQAESLDNELALLEKKIDFVFYFDVPAEDLVLRLSQRISCKNCSSIFSKIDKEYICSSNCKEQILYQREDDKPEAISKRMESYISLTTPLIDFYDKKRIMININANKSILEVSKEIDEIMQS